jgi:hypothetical protein
MPPITRTEISVTDIGEYVRHRSCDRRFFLKVHYDREVARHLPFFDRLLNTLDPVLREVGRQREDQWETELRGHGFLNVAEKLPRGKHDEVLWKDFKDQLRALPVGQPAYGRQVRVAGVIGAFEVSGIIDFVLVRWGGTCRTSALWSARQAGGTKPTIVCRSPSTVCSCFRCSPGAL